MHSRPTETPSRIDALDAARGFAIALMILSHTVKGLLPFKLMPDWGIVPVHAITKFSSTLFILVFGITLAVVFLPKVGTEQWPVTRVKLWKRGLLIFISYKLLVWVQMFQIYPKEEIIDTLLSRRFPDFVEILQFYGWFLLLTPIFLPMWSRLPFWGKILTCYLLGASSMLLQQVDFGDFWQLKAILVEYPRTYCFGLMPRGTMVLFGLILGDRLVDQKTRERSTRELSAVCLLLGTMLLGTFVLLYYPQLQKTVLAIAKNAGKHPPKLPFMLYSIGGSLMLIGLFLRMTRAVRILLSPLVTIGRESLFCFNFHIVVIFIGYRYLLDLRHHVTYPQALLLTGSLLVLSVIGAQLNGWTKTWRNYQNAQAGEGEPSDTDLVRADDDRVNERSRPITDLARDFANRRGENREELQRRARRLRERPRF